MKKAERSGGMKNILELSNVTKKYDGFLLDNISFELKKGYIMGFVGPNGAGKSTTIRLIMNLLRLAKGKIKIFGKDHIKHEKDIKEKIGFVYDENHYCEVLKIKEVGSILSGIYKKWDNSSFNSYLNRFDLDSNKKIEKLSKGMKTKFSLAIALSHNAELIIMDEPTSGLDPVVRTEFLEMLSEIVQDENKSVLLSTHVTSDLEKIADYITFIKSGKIQFSSTKDEIMESYRLVKGPISELDGEIVKKSINYRKNSMNFEALFANLEGINVQNKKSIIVEKPTLDDIMIHSVKGDKKC